MAALINRPPSDIPKRKTSVSGTHHPLPTNHKHTAGGINAAATVTGSGANTATSSAASTTQNSSSAGSTSATSSSEKCKKPSLNRERVELRRVTFAIDKLAYDPQQQIPSRRPKKGDVIIPEDLVAPLQDFPKVFHLAMGKIQ